MAKKYILNVWDETQGKYAGVPAIKGARGDRGEKGDKGDTGQAGPAGVGINSVSQTASSDADGGVNVITFTMTDGSTYSINVRNGSKGEQGDPGVDGADLSTEVEALDARVTENYTELYDLIMAAASNINTLDARVTQNYNDLYELIMAAASNINALETRVAALEGGGS